MKKIVLIILLFCMPFITNAYTSNEFFNINYTGNNNIIDIYIIPDGKDLLITNIYNNNESTGSLLHIYDNMSNVAINSFIELKNLNIIIKDLLQLQDTGSNNNYIITGILINENEDITNYINKTNYGLNKPIFNNETILEIYKIESVIMVFILFYTFFLRVIGKRNKKYFNF